MAFRYVKEARKAESLLHKLLSKRCANYELQREVTYFTKVVQRKYDTVAPSSKELFRLNVTSLKASLEILSRIDRSSNTTKENKKGNTSKGNDKKGKNNKGRDGFLLKQLIAGVVLTFGCYCFMFLSVFGKEITWQDFVDNYLGKTKIEFLAIRGNDVCIVRFAPDNVKWFTIGDLDSFEYKLEKAQNEKNIPVNERLNVVYETQLSGPGNIQRFPISEVFFVLLMSTVVLSLLLSGKKSTNLSKLRSKNSSMFSQRNMFAMPQQSNAKVVKSNIKFKDIAGCDEAKAEIEEFVSFLKNPDKYRDLGAKIPKGAVLTGPPGTGKTLLAKATSGEADVPFIHISGSDFVEVYVGVGPARVRDMFKLARSKAPCILFIDEIDAVGSSRGSKDTESSNTVNELLVQMDGIKPQNDVIVLAATNKIESLDQALLRAGRFDRQIVVGVPDLKGREELFQLYLKGLTTDLDKKNLAKRLSAYTAGFTGADVANLCNEAALIAARDALNTITLKEFERATDRVVAGIEKKSRVLSPEEKKVVAYHEAGHAVAAWFLEHADPMQKVSIIPTAEALGYAMYLPQDIYLLSKEQIDDKICVAFGGRVSEEIFFNQITTGARDDLEKITEMAYNQIKRFGMGEGGMVDWINARPSDKITEQLDVEVRKLLISLYSRTRDLLLFHKEGIEKLAQILLEKEKIDRDDLIAILGKRPFTEVLTYDDVLQRTYKKNMEVFFLNT